jgi:hypothetical protein
MHKRWRNLQDARKFVGADPIETEHQWAFTKGIDQYINEIQQKYYEAHPLTERHLISPVHQHTCAFTLLSNDKSWCAAQCRKEKKKLPPPPEEWMEPCDYCPKMTLITFDNDLNIIYASRTFTEDIIKWAEEKQECLSRDQ